MPSRAMLGLALAAILPVSTGRCAETLGRFASGEELIDAAEAGEGGISLVFENDARPAGVGQAPAVQVPAGGAAAAETSKPEPSAEQEETPVPVPAPEKEAKWDDPDKPRFFRDLGYAVISPIVYPVAAPFVFAQGDAAQLGKWAEVEGTKGFFIGLLAGPFIGIGAFGYNLYRSAKGLVKGQP